MLTHSHQEDQAQPVLATLRQQLIQASEIERVAMMLSSAHASIARLLDHHKELSAVAGKGPSGAVSLNAGVTELRERAKSLDDQVAKAAHDVLYQTLIGVQATSSLTDGSASPDGAAVRALRCRVFGHGLRALACLHRGAIASSLVAESVVYPLARYIYAYICGLHWSALPVSSHSCHPNPPGCPGTC